MNKTEEIHGSAKGPCISVLDKKKAVSKRKQHRLRRVASAYGVSACRTKGGGEARRKRDGIKTTVRNEPHGGL